MRKTREEKAITLIALIITIVVLLILAVIAINAVTGDGIIQHAVNAKEDYEKAQAEENSMISYYQAYLDTEGQVGKWTQNKTKVSRVNSDGTVDELEVGDLISNYKSATNTAIEWKVLGAEDGKVLLVSATNVATETLTGREDYMNNTGINRLNAIGANYDDGIGAVEGSGRSIDVDDINRVTGYNPQKTGTGEPFYYYTFENLGNNKRVTQYLNRVTYTINEEGKIYFSSDLVSGIMPYEAKYHNFQHVDGTTLVKESDYTGAAGTAKSITVESTFYKYAPVSLSLDASLDTEVRGISAQSKAYKLLFEGTDENTEKAYWLASSCARAGDGYAYFSIRLVGGGYVGGYSLWKSEICTSSSTERGVRAVVSLKSDVQFTSAGENIYNISIVNQ